MGGLENSNIIKNLFGGFLFSFKVQVFNSQEKRLRQKEKRVFQKNNGEKPTLTKGETDQT